VACRTLGGGDPGGDFAQHQVGLGDVEHGGIGDQPVHDASDTIGHKSTHVAETARSDLTRTGPPADSPGASLQCRELR
jgi:hypothetical protein